MLEKGNCSTGMRFTPNRSFVKKPITFGSRNIVQQPTLLQQNSDMNLLLSSQNSVALRGRSCYATTESRCNRVESVSA